MNLLKYLYSFPALAVVLELEELRGNAERPRGIQDIFRTLVLLESTTGSDIINIDDAHQVLIRRALFSPSSFPPSCGQSLGISLICYSTKTNCNQIGLRILWVLTSSSLDSCLLLESLFSFRSVLLKMQAKCAIGSRLSGQMFSHEKKAIFFFSLRTCSLIISLSLSFRYVHT
jgi:hypothetical protein